MRRRWIDDTGYADLVALCQFLPGPTSSQVGFALGLLRGGPAGAIAAWIGFTMPSALAMLAFAYGASAFAGPGPAGVVHALKLVAVAVVAQAVLGMTKTLAPDRRRAGIALLALLMVTFARGSVGQVGAIATGAVLGLWFCRGLPAKAAGPLPLRVSRRAGAACLVLFLALLLGLPMIVPIAGGHGLLVFDSFYRAGSLVFGGGHVVLPLLEAEVVRPGWTSDDVFLTGYGAAQAVPGPLFTFAAYLGAVLEPEPNGIAGASIALAGIFLPGLLLVMGTLPFWDALRTRAIARAAMAGANAAVVGILGAALFDPVWQAGIETGSDFALAVVAFVLLVIWKAPPWIVVTGAIAGAAAFSLIR